MWDWFREIIRKIINLIIRIFRTCGCLPYNPGKWNDGGAIQRNNNCYNYGCDIQTNTFAQPGRASGNMYQSIDCAEVGDGARSDGLVNVNCDTACPCGTHKVALVIAPGYDYHWYQYNCNGRWSHKPGSTPATDRDNSGNLITDPRRADRGPYTVFCGCFCVDKSRVHIS